jgi:hypothetical protein
MDDCWFSATSSFLKYISHPPGDARQVCFCTCRNSDEAGTFVCEVIDDFKHAWLIVNRSEDKISEYAFHSRSSVRLALMQNRFAPTTVTQ